jgi:hypothetical protein
VRWHLFRCALCRRRAAESEAELFRLFRPYERALDVFSPDEADSRRRLLSSIRAVASAQPLTLPQPAEFPSRTALISAGLLAASVLVVFFVATPARRPVLAADAVLSRAAGMESVPGPQARPGIIFERVVLRVRKAQSGERFEWPVYRDAQGKRKPYFQQASERESVLKERLAAAGVTRENPLSAASFESWRTSFRVHADNVAYSPAGLITVTTSVPEDSASQVREETLVLRSEDYHPLARTVAFRDEETVEIAEVEYQVLDWHQAQRGWFEELPQPVQFHSLPNSVRASIPVPSATLTEPQLVLAELQARAILSRQNADVNEQIELARRPDGIAVQGLVSTLERKQEIQTALATVSHVTVKVSTPAERDAAGSEVAKARPASGDVSVGASVKMIESVSRPSPLLLYWNGRHLNSQEFPHASWQLLDSALRISQQSRALSALTQEFASKSLPDEATREAYQGLWSDHAQKLRAALNDQLRMVKNMAPSLPDIAAPAMKSGSQATADDLDRMASTSLGLCRELTAGNESGQREAAAILADLAREDALIASALDQLSAQKH